MSIDARWASPVRKKATQYLLTGIILLIYFKIYFYYLILPELNTTKILLIVRPLPIIWMIHENNKILYTNTVVNLL